MLTPIREVAMTARFRWTTGTVLFLYVCGVLLGANLVAVVNAMGSGARPLGPLLGLLLALLLPVLPLWQARRTG
jgi:hypothetical protein